MREVATFTVGRRCRAVRGRGGIRTNQAAGAGLGTGEGRLGAGGLPAGPRSWGLGCARVRADGVGHSRPPSLTTAPPGKTAARERERIASL